MKVPGIEKAISELPIQIRILIHAIRIISEKHPSYLYKELKTCTHNPLYLDQVGASPSSKSL